MDCEKDLVDSQLPVLESLSQHLNPASDDPPVKPADSGAGAWAFLLAAFLVESIVWGLPICYGVFLAEYLKNPIFAEQRGASTLLPLIGPLCSGLMYGSGLIWYPLMSMFPIVRRPMAWIGVLVCWASLFAASFTSDIKLLLVLQGILYALGGSMLYSSCISYMNEWFVCRRGLANGVINAGTSIGGLILPLVLPAPLQQWGIDKTLRALSVVLLVVLLPALPFIRARLPEKRVARAHGVSPSQNRTWTRNPIFWLLACLIILHALAYYIPGTWLPTFAGSLGLNAGQSALAVALLNASSAIGRLIIGYSADHLCPWLLSSTILSGACVTTFVLWGVFGHSAGAVLAFGIVYGLTAGSFCSLWTSLIRPIAKDDSGAATTIFGLLLAVAGLGTVLSPLIATSLLVKSGLDMSSIVTPQYGFAVDGGRYQWMIVYAGACFIGTAVVSLAGWFIQQRRR